MFKVQPDVVRKCIKRNNVCYYYFRCSSACGCRYKGKEVNAVFIDQLAGYEVKDKLTTLFSAVIKDIYYKQFGSLTDNRTK